MFKETKVAAIAAKHQTVADMLFSNIVNTVHGLKAFKVKRHADAAILNVGGRMIRFVYKLQGRGGDLAGSMNVIEGNRLLRQVYWTDEGYLTNGLFNNPLDEAVTSKQFAKTLLQQVCNRLFDLREPIV